MITTIRGQYHLLEKLGSGGMGDVYQARDAKLNRMVAVKLLKPDPGGDPGRRRRFLQEAQAASSLNHPNIVTIYDVVTEGELEVIIMEYVGGKTLSDIIPRGGLRVPQLINYGLQIADGLAAAHAAGIIHRDLKPGNIMVTENERVKILDFGLAKLEFRSNSNDPDATSDSPLTVQGSIVGTLSYMSPEQAQGLAVDARSDIFSFGAVLYEAATGLRAFSGDNGISTLTSVLRDEPARIFGLTPDVPAELEELIHRCLRKNPDERYPVMQDVRQVLGGLKQSSDSGILYRPAGLPSQVSAAASTTVPKPEKNRLPVVAGFAFALLLLGAFGWWFFRKEELPGGNVASGSSSPLPNPTGAIDVAERTAPPLKAVPDASILTNDQIIQMVKAKVPATLIVNQIRASSEHRFDLSPDQLIRMVQSGVPEQVVEAMRNPSGTRVAEGAKAEPANELTLADGTPVRLLLKDDVPLDSEPGKTLQFTVAANVLIGGKVAIAKGANATGTVLSVDKKRKFLMVGGGMRMLVNLREVYASNGERIVIRATVKQKAGQVSSRSLETTGPKAPDIAAAKGSPFTGYVAGDQTLQLR